jgi:hypothetical protein
MREIAWRGRVSCVWFLQMVLRSGGREEGRSRRHVLADRKRWPSAGPPPWRYPVLPLDSPLVSLSLPRPLSTTHTHSLSLSHSLSLTLSLSHSLTPTLSLSRTLSLPHTHTLSQMQARLRNKPFLRSVPCVIGSPHWEGNRREQPTGHPGHLPPVAW